MSAPVSLYDVLGVPATATAEEIRKAYRRRALQTHPDRIGPNATAEQKQRAEDSFRKVNAAYEVLNDPANRNLYDQHGVWPPPEPAAPEEPPLRQRHRSFSGGNARDRQYSRSRRQPPQPGFPDPPPGFVDPPFGPGHRRNSPFAFSDPFELFDNLFGDVHSAFASDPFFSRHPFFVQPEHMLFASPFERADRLLASAFDDPFFAQAGGDGRMFSSHSSSFSARPDGTRERRTKTVTNGRVEEVHERWDGQGNHYVTRTRDGKTTHIVNGVERIEGPKSTVPPTAPAPLPPPPPYVPPLLSSSSSRRQRHRSQPVPTPPPPPPPPRMSPPPPPSYAYPDYARHARSYATGPPPPPPSVPFVPPPSPPMYGPEDHHKKHWWSRRR